jgi:lysophospholipase L1-like esterase
VFSRKSAFIAAAVLGSIFLALVVAEVGLRIAGFSYELRATVVDATAPQPTVFYKHFNLDRQLLWVPRSYQAKLERAKGKPLDIAFTGDSCTQIGTYHEMLARLVASRKKKNIEIINLGVAGWTTDQGMRQIVRDLPPLRPEVITVYFGWNDHWLSIGIEDDDIAQINESFLFNFSQFKVAQVLTRAVVARKTKDPRPKRVPEDDFRENLERILTAAEHMGAVPVLLTAPSIPPRGPIPPDVAGRWIEDESQRGTLHKSYADIVRQVTAERNAILCDLAAHFDTLHPRIRFRHFLNDGIHLTESGNREVAKHLYGCLEKSGILDVLLD